MRCVKFLLYVILLAFCVSRCGSAGPREAAGSQMCPGPGATPPSSFGETSKAGWAFDPARSSAFSLLSSPLPPPRPFLSCRVTQQLVIRGGGATRQRSDAIYRREVAFDPPSFFSSPLLPSPFILACGLIWGSPPFGVSQRVALASSLAS